VPGFQQLSLLNIGLRGGRLCRFSDVGQESAALHQAGGSPLAGPIGMPDRSRESRSGYYAIATLKVASLVRGMSRARLGGGFERRANVRTGGSNPLSSSRGSVTGLDSSAEGEEFCGFAAVCSRRADDASGGAQQVVPSQST
jgi:hypothetical protein